MKKIVKAMKPLMQEINFTHRTNKVREPSSSVLPELTFLQHRRQSVCGARHSWNSLRWQSYPAKTHGWELASHRRKGYTKDSIPLKVNVNNPYPSRNKWYSSWPESYAWQGCEKRLVGGPCAVLTPAEGRRDDAAPARILPRVSSRIAWHGGRYTRSRHRHEHIWFFSPLFPWLTFIHIFTPFLILVAHDKHFYISKLTQNTICCLLTTTFTVISKSFASIRAGKIRIVDQCWIIVFNFPKTDGLPRPSVFSYH